MISVYPSTEALSEDIPERSREFLKQASESLAQAAASTMASASAVDAMLKNKGLKEGSLFARIDKAVETNFINPDMGKLAHQVRTSRATRTRPCRFPHRKMPLAPTGLRSRSLRCSTWFLRVSLAASKSRRSRVNKMGTKQSDHAGHRRRLPDRARTLLANLGRGLGDVAGRAACVRRLPRLWSVAGHLKVE